MLKKHVVVDGSNIATEGRSTPSLTQLDEAVRAFIAEHPTEQVTVIVDATFGHRIHESEQEAFEQAVDAGELLTAPAGTIGRGDAFILEVADKADATVLSNDSFQEFHGRYPWLFDEDRLIGGKPVPGVGWVFLPRSPVRGPVSRRSVKEAKASAAAKKAKKATKATKGAARKARVTKGASEAPVAHEAEGKAARARAAKKPSKARRQATEAERILSDPETTKAVARAAADDGTGARKRARKPLEPLNAPLPFIEFVGAHPVGSTVQGVVERFSSHGAYVTASGARCYVPLKLMADPPPRSAKEVLRVGETRDFVVVAIDPPRRGIDLALPEVREPSITGVDMPADQQEQRATSSKRSRARTQRDHLADARDVDATASDATNETRATRDETAKTHTKAATLATNTRADQRAEEAPVTPARKRKAAAKRTAKKSAKRSPARRKKAAAKRTGKKRAAKRTAKKRATKRSPARRKKAAAKRPAKKRASKKRASKKRATKKRATKKRASKKRATKKRASKKRATKKRATKKRATKRRATKRRSAASNGNGPTKKRASKRRARRRR